MSRAKWLMAAAPCLGLVLASGVQAGTWSETLFTDDASTQISTGKTYTHAYDLNSDDAGATVNGVTLAIGTLTESNYTFLPATGWTPHQGSATTIDDTQGIEDALDDFFYGPAAQTLTLSGLTGGGTYSFRTYVGGWAGAMQVLDADDDQGNTLTTDRGTAAGGKFIEYVYTLPANDTNIAFTFTSVDGSNTFHHYAFTNEALEIIPEPAALSLLGLGGFGLLARRRRNNA